MTSQTKQHAPIAEDDPQVQQLKVTESQRVHTTLHLKKRSTHVLHQLSVASAHNLHACRAAQQCMLHWRRGLAVSGAEGHHQSCALSRKSKCLFLLAQDCLADNDRDWRKCQARVSSSVVPCREVLSANCLWAVRTCVSFYRLSPQVADSIICVPQK